METLLEQSRLKEVLDWLLASSEPWTRYRTLLDLLERPEEDPDVHQARLEMLADPAVGSLTETASTLGSIPFKRHNDAGHSLYRLGVLADFGLRFYDLGMQPILQASLAHQSFQGAYQSLVNVSLAFGGTGQDSWGWMACDAPSVLAIMLAMGAGSQAGNQMALDHLALLVEGNGWRCAVSQEMGRFHGPGRRTDPCPIANVFALKALSLAPGMLESPAVLAGIEMLLGHWEKQKETKFYLFGIGKDFHKLKYPWVWYDILHVVEVLSRFPAARRDPRFEQMLLKLWQSSGMAETGRITAASMYQSWKGWSFADKKVPSPWLTFVVLRILKRTGKIYFKPLEMSSL